MAKRRPIVVTVTVADLDKAIGFTDMYNGKFPTNPLNEALRRHRKRREETIVIPLAASIGGQGYSHRSPIVDQFEMGLHADIFESLPTKVTFYPTVSVPHGWESVTA